MRGFTLVELLVVMAVLATLLTLVAPRYQDSVVRAKEAVLRENLYQLRDAVDKYHADKARYPETLEALVAERYVRRLPLDPLTDSAATWIAVPPADPAAAGVADVRSGATGRSLDGTDYAAW
jgi:general secretion pathway protein G